MGHRHSSLRSFALGVFVTLISLLALRSREALAQGSCVTLENQLKGLEAGQARLQKDLQRAAGEDKQSLVQQIKELESEIRQKQAEQDLVVLFVPASTIAQRVATMYSSRPRWHSLL